MSDESVSSAQPVAASATSTAVHPAPGDPSVGVRVTQQVRETLTDLAGVVLAGYLVSRGAITGVQALYFALALLLPSPVLVRLAKVLGARASSAGAGAAMALLGASAGYASLKSYAVAGAGVLSVAACLGGCAAGQTPVLTPIAPRVIHRAEWGTCVETGGKIELPRTGVVAMLTSACFAPMDAAVALNDASAALDESEPPIPDKRDAGAVE